MPLTTDSPDSPADPVDLSSPKTADPLPATLALAERLLQGSLEAETGTERRHRAAMARLVEDPPGKRFTVRMADEVFRSQNSSAAARRLRQLAAATGVPSWLGPVERTLLRLGIWASRIFPGLVMPAMAAQLRRESSEVILPGEIFPLNRYLSQRHAGGIRVNLNQLGEAVLGEEEAEHRLESILHHLANPAVDYVSVKISAVFSQINLVAWQDTLDCVKARLRRLYRAAMAAVPPADASGAAVAKFVNLDMEEYRDFELTLQAFQEVLDEPEFSRLYAGIVLQAYLPDSWPRLRSLTEWAKKRHAVTGGRIKVRLVKGANLAMERVDAELHGWEPAPYHSKPKVDANFKRMLEYALRPDCCEAVQVGVGSHNLFDVALALTLARQQGVLPSLDLEMLEGMANQQARTVRDEAGGILLYAPVVKRQDFPSAMAYLVRRLEENTAPDNFLRDLFGITPGSPAWQKQRQLFLEAWDARQKVASSPRRSGNRLTESMENHRRHVAGPFANVPDTDWTLAVNREWADGLLRKWQDQKAEPIPLSIGENLLLPNTDGEVRDPSRPDRLPDRHALAGPAEVDAALHIAVAGGARWAETPPAARSALLRECAAMLASRRGDLIGCMMTEGAKAIAEADVEISEAVDFATFYAGAFNDAGTWLDGLRPAPLGVVVVTPPWNFPLAIPCGGVLAALMAGNAVILKPAPEAVRTGWLLANCLWDAGVPRDALQFLPCPDNETGQALLTDSRTSAVILTGAWETAQLFRSWKPDLTLLAETSGKNALIITAQADRDLAIKDLVRSAFGHAGQKCSAASLAILEAEVYDDPSFRRQLRDAAASLRTGSAHDPASIVTPLIREPGPALLRALTTLDPGEEWLLRPECFKQQPNLWSPGIRLGVLPGSWFHRTECFGPVLGLMRADSLEQAVALQNDSAFGLTAGIHSLDESEIRYWRDRVQAGNGYINRAITGAIVRRQPFGGWKRSSIGPGAKAGGPNYVFSLCHWTAVDDPALSNGNCCDFPAAWQQIFSQESDPSGLTAESNVFRYVPAAGVVLRINGPEDSAATELAVLAAKTCGTPLEISSTQSLPVNPPGGTRLTVESESALAARLPELARHRHCDTLRTLRPPSPALLQAAFEAGCRWIDAPVLPKGRIELPRWLREQALSETRHRYGNPIFRPSS